VKRILVYLAFASLTLVPIAHAAFPSISVSMPNTPGSGWFTSSITVTFTVPAGATPGGNCFQVGANSFPVSQQGTTTLTCSASNSEGTDQKTVNVRIDSVAPTVTGGSPTRAPDQAGWYNEPVALSGGGNDPSPGSGLAGCSGGTYSGPDSVSATGTITCTDNAGNSNSAASSAFKYDNTGPSITGAAPARAPDSNGWYNHAVSVSFTATDNLSGVAGCTPVTYSGPDGASAGVPSGCTDVAGNGSTGSASINYDGSGPSVSGSPDRPPDSNGWYSHAVNVSIAGSDATSGLAGCSGGGTYSGPDGRGQVTGSCTDNAGNSGSGGVEIPYDSTPPQVTGAAADRPPDANGWYNHGFSFTFQGTDAGSGVGSCTSGSYGGPDGAAATVTGTCTDKAGHTSAPKQQTFKYDATPPSLSGVVAQVGNKFALLKWKLSSDVASVRVTRTPGRGGEASTVVYNGKADFYKDSGIDNRATYEYRVSASDEAANSTPEEKASAVPLPPLFNPSAGARVKAPILLEWLAVPNATFYNVQVWCGRRKILTAWPKRPRLVVPRVGKFAGKKYTLPRGACKWYVWPGHGRLTERRYGRLAGLSTFFHTR
jgi:hypothetical protein